MAFLIFDFDGTIADTLEAIVDITNRLAPKYGYSPTTPEKLQYYQSLSTQEMLKQSEIPLFHLPFLLRRVRRELGAELDDVAIAPDLIPTLNDLVNHGHELMIMSSNSQKNIQRFLCRYEIDHLFTSVQGGVGLLSKSRVLKRIVRRDGIDFSQVIYVGDETRDVDASRQTGILIAAVSWGFSSRAALANQDPDFLVDHPRQILGAAQTLVNPSWIRREYRTAVPLFPASQPGLMDSMQGGRGARPSL